MPSVTAQEIIDAAMELEEGEKIITRCRNFADMEALRSHLYKTKARLSLTHKTLAYSLYISREVKDGIHFVVISKELGSEREAIVVVNKEGQVKPFERSVPASISEENERDRMLRLMEEDGMSPEEIQDALIKTGEDDFDKAAAKIEETQGLAQEPEEDMKGGE